MKIAVIGGGIFGCTSAIELARRGFAVTLYERQSDLMRSASGCNQYRLHRGYHYPRSPETATQSLTGIESFMYEYGAAVSRGGKHYYAIPREGSKVNKKQYIDFLEAAGLSYKLVTNVPHINYGEIDSVFSVREDSMDITFMRNLVYEKLSAAGVEVKLGTVFSENDNYEVIVNATYSNLNSILPADQRLDYQFEICEKPVVTLPSELRGLSIVVIDGEFGCVDPFGNTSMHVAGHVKHAIHRRNIDHFPAVPHHISTYIDCGCSGKVNFSSVDKMMAGVGKYVNLGDWSYNYSMFAVRTVLPSHEHDDARPTYVTKHNDRLYSIFSGKIGTACDAAEQLCGMIAVNNAVSIRDVFDRYRHIRTEEGFLKVLKSGMFWEFHPELTGDWSKDIITISQGQIYAPRNRCR